MTVTRSLSGSFSRVINKLRLSASSRKSSTTSVVKTLSTSSNSSSSSLSSFTNILNYTNRLFRKKRSADPREIVLTPAHMEHQAILNQFSWAEATATASEPQNRNLYGYSPRNSCDSSIPPK